jgi:4-hydroxythreonine-4-phosphate dehydrogenase
MILASDALKVATVTGHVPVSKIADTLKEENITASIELLAKSLKRDFGCVKPSIAVLGLNPHAGEFGAIGSEEADIIKPAIEKADVKGAIVRGPFPADGFFGQGYDQKFDAVLGNVPRSSACAVQSIGHGKWDELHGRTHCGKNFT